MRAKLYLPVTSLGLKTSLDCIIADAVTGLPPEGDRGQVPGDDGGGTVRTTLPTAAEAAEAGANPPPPPHLAPIRSGRGAFTIMNPFTKFRL